MINFSLGKLRSSEATETFRAKKSDNVLTKSRKLETKSRWIIKLRSFFKFEKAKEPRLADFNFSLLYISISRHLCLATMTCVHMQLVLHVRDSRSVGAPN